MRILAVDISLCFSMAWEASEGKEFSAAFNRTIDNVRSARVGYDRVMLAIDSGPSFRKVCEEYKSKRTDRGEAYREQLKRTIDRCVADGCVPIVAPPVGTFPLTGVASYAEADDVIGWAVEEYSKLVAPLGEEAMSDWAFAILSDDGDFEQLIDDAANVYVVKSALRGGERWNAGRVLEKRGVSPRQIVDMKALVGDDSDDYDGFCGEMMPQDPATPNVKPKRKPGIGPGNAVPLIKTYGGALEIFDAGNPEKWEADGIKPGIRATLARHGRALAERGVFLASIRRDLPGLDFGAVLAEPVVKPIAAPRTFDDAPPDVIAEPVSAPAPKAVDAPPTQALAVRAPAALAITASPTLDTLAFQPTSPASLWKTAETLFNSRVYAQFPNVESVFACIFEARERGVSAGVALRNAYIVKGKLAWSAAFMVALVKDSGLCRVFRIVETTPERAVLEYQHRDDAAPRLFEFTIGEAAKAGWLKSGERGDGKWLTNPRSMLRWAAMREVARFAWPEVVAGIFMPDERRDGRTEEGDYPDEAEAA